MSATDSSPRRVDRPTESNRAERDDVTWAHDVIARAISSAVQQLCDELPRAREGVDPEGAHQARVATRRLRSDLRTFGPVLDEAWTVQMRAELKVLTDALGQVRDLDVLRIQLVAVLDDLADDADSGNELLERLDDQRRRAHDDLTAVIDDERTVSLLARLAEASAAPPTTERAQRRATRRLLPLVRSPWRRVDRAARELDDEPSVADLHRLRLLAKHARYAAEAVTPVYGRQARRFAKAVARLQDALGQLNDAEQAERWLRKQAAELDASTAFTAGLMVSSIASAAGAHREDWRPALAKARRLADWLD